MSRLVLTQKFLPDRINKTRRLYGATSETQGGGSTCAPIFTQDMTQLAKDRGQTATYVLDQAVEHYIRYVAPTQGTVRPEIMARARKSIEKNRRLLELLAQ